MHNNHTNYRFTYMSNKKWKYIVRNYKSRKIQKRFKCDCCKVVYDRGFMYSFDDSAYYLCYDCRNKFLPGKIQGWMLYFSDFEKNKSKH